MLGGHQDAVSRDNLFRNCASHSVFLFVCVCVTLMLNISSFAMGVCAYSI